MRTIWSDFSLNSEEEKQEFQFNNDLFNLNKTITMDHFNSEIEANNIVNSIINDVIEKIIDNYFVKKIPDYLVKNLIINSKQILKIELGYYDQDDNKYIEKYNENDDEPSILKIDNWARNKIQKNKINLKVNNILKMETRNSSKNSNIKQVVKDIIKNNKRVPKPIELFERNDYISWDEKNYRFKKDKQNKEYEQKKKEEKLRNDNKDKEKLENEKKLNDNTKDFTFDFDGRLIQINNLKQNKINQIVLNSKVRIKKKSQDLDKDNLKTTNKTEPMSTKLIKQGSLPMINALVERNNELNKNSKPIPFSNNKLYENFEMSEGVSFFGDGRKKEKQKKVLNNTTSKYFNMTRQNFLKADKTKSSKKLDISKKFNFTNYTKNDKVKKIPKENNKIINEINKINNLKKNYSKNIICYNNLNSLIVSKQDEIFYETAISSNIKKNIFKERIDDNFEYETTKNLTYNFAYNTVYPKIKKKNVNKKQNKSKERYFRI